MAAREPNELEQALADITTNKSITNYLIINSEGVPIRWEGWDTEGDGYNEVVKVSAVMSDLVMKAQKACGDLLEPGENIMEKIRLRTKENEIIIAPGRECTLIVYQKYIPPKSLIEKTPITKEEHQAPPPPPPA